MTEASFTSIRDMHRHYGHLDNAAQYMRHIATHISMQLQSSLSLLGATLLTQKQNKKQPESQNNKLWANILLHYILGKPTTASQVMRHDTFFINNERLQTNKYYAVLLDTCPTTTSVNHVPSNFVM